jgi:hypothetical protein
MKVFTFLLLVSKALAQRASTKAEAPIKWNSEAGGKAIHSISSLTPLLSPSSSAATLSYEILSKTQDGLVEVYLGNGGTLFQL